MSKGERTRRMIVERAAPVFNTRGYFGASLQNLIEETGLQKGGIYNHFASKEELALAALDFAVGLLARRYQEALVGKERALDRLLAIIGAFRGLTDNTPVPGGCPILNTAVEADDTYPVLRDRARAAMDDWQRLLGSIVKRGVEAGELRPEADPRAVATVITATLEGALMLSKLYDDPAHLDRATEHLTQYLEALVQR